VTITVTPTLEPIGQLLTPEEYDALPENHLRELVDGVIQMMATPTPWHQDVKFELIAQLKRLAPARLRVTGEVEITLSPKLRRNPDVVVVRTEGYDRRRPQLRPSQVLVAVEIVSNGTESTDRILKPIEYAQAGIEHFWRVELDPGIVVHTYRLTGAPSYEHTGAFGKGEVIAAPGLGWARVPIEALSEA
jgi:Uma2 family endonuclease